MNIRQFLINFNESVKQFPATVNFTRLHGIKPFMIETQLTITERTLLYSLATRLQHGATLVEIGSYRGGSSQFLGCAAQSLNGKLYCVDTWKSDAMTVERHDTYEDFLRNTAVYGSSVQPLRGRSVEIAKTFHGIIDLLFIDGDHSYEGCRMDVETWSKKLRNGAILIFHDYSWALGVRRVVEEFIVPYQISPGKLIHGTYWTSVSFNNTSLAYEHENH